MKEVCSVDADVVDVLVYPNPPGPGSEGRPLREAGRTSTTERKASGTYEDESNEKEEECKQC